VIQHLQASRPDVVALQLVSREVSQAVAAALGWQPSGVRHCCAGGSELYGNAVLSAHRVLSSESYDLPAPAGFHPRCLLCVELELPEGESRGGEGRGRDQGRGGEEEQERRSLPSSLTFCSAHLENTSEHIRMVQAEAMATFLDSLGRPHVLCGDMNALLVSDFPPAAWEYLCQIAEANGWEERQETVMRFLLDRQGYTDAMGPPPLGQRKADEEGPEVDNSGDSRFTFFLPPAGMWIRIDYILLSRGFPGSSVGCTCSQVQGASNHHPVTAELAVIMPGS